MDSLFKDVNFYIFEKNVERSTEIKAAMRSGGASREFYLSDLVTHIISDSPIEQSTLSLLNCHVLHSDWVIMSVKCGAQLPTAPFDLSKPKLFSGLTFTTSKIPRADVEKLAVLVFYHGGKFQTKLDPNVTHLITVEPSGAKYECALAHADTVRVVTPDWVVDSVEHNKRLEEGDYRVSQSRRGSGRDQESSSLVVTSSSVQTVSRESVENGTSQPSHQPQPSRVIPTTSTTITPLTTHSSTVPSTVDLTSITSSTAHSTTVTPSTTITPSTTSLTSVGEEARQRDSNHHSVRGQPETEDLQASAGGGEDPGIELLSGMVVCLSDYQECMDPGTVDKWTQVIEQHGGSVMATYDRRKCTHLLALHKKSDVFAKAFADGKCIASAHWLNDVLTELKMFPPRNAVHFPTAFKWQLLGAENYSITLSNYTDHERNLVKDMIRICGIPCTGHLDKSTTHLVCKRPEGKKYVKAQEWGVQVINATFLADIIHNGQVPAVLFPRYTRLGLPEEFSPGSCFEASSLLKPWEAFMESYSKAHPRLVDQASTRHTFTSLTSSQTTPTDSTIGKHERTDVVEEPGVKKQKLDGGAEVVRPRVPVVLVTGISQSVAKALKNSVVQLGGRVTERGRECTHIVLPRVTRTVKFLCGISVCEHVVTPAWVESSVREGRFVGEGGFALVDKDAEELFGMEVSTSLARARGKKLLQGLCLHSTSSVQPPYSALKDIVHCAGGELLTLSELKSRFGRKLDRAVPSQVVIISTPEDVAAGQCTEFFSCGLEVYNAELVLTGILKQELNFSLNKLSV